MPADLPAAGLPASWLASMQSGTGNKNQSPDTHTHTLARTHAHQHSTARAPVALDDPAGQHARVQLPQQPPLLAAAAVLAQPHCKAGEVGFVGVQAQSPACRWRGRLCLSPLQAVVPKQCGGRQREAGQGKAGSRVGRGLDGLSQPAGVGGLRRGVGACMMAAAPRCAAQPVCWPPQFQQRPAGRSGTHPPTHPPAKVMRDQFWHWRTARVATSPAGPAGRRRRTSPRPHPVLAKSGHWHWWGQLVKSVKSIKSLLLSTAN